MNAWKKGLALVAVTLGALSSTAIFAQDLSSEFDSVSTPSDSKTAEKDAKAPVVSISGDHSFVFHEPVYGDALDYNSVAKAPSAWNLLDLEYTNDALKAVLKPNLKWSSWGSVSQWELLPSESYVSWSPNAWKISAGWKEYAWGVADQKNPTDYLNPHDYRVGTDNRKLPVFSIDAVWYPAEWISLEEVYIPYKQNSVFPKDFAANLRTKLSTYSGGAYNLSVTTAEPENTPRSAVSGSRANLFLPGVDLSFSYLYDWDTFYTPVIQMTLGGSGYGPTSIELVKKRIHRFGLNAKTTVDRFGLWLETAYNVTEDPNGTDDTVRNNKWAWTAGFDFNYGPNNDFYANVQYAGEWIPGFDSATSSDYPTSAITANAMNSTYMKRYFYRSLTQSLGSETEEWLHALTASFKFPLFDQTVTPSLSGAYILPVGYDSTNATRYGSMVLKPEIDLMPVDSFHILIGADILYAWIKNSGSDSVVLDTQNDKIGVYTPDNNVYIKLQYKWGSKF